jgi:cyclophilin family peptidyl-prolyl cis-trans isomerase
MVAMARGESPDSAGSQFFILIAESVSFDQPYSVFGDVIEGMEVVEQISEEPGESVAELGGFNPAQHQYIEQCILEERPAE